MAHVREGARERPHGVRQAARLHVRVQFARGVDDLQSVLPPASKLPPRFRHIPNMKPNTWQQVGKLGDGRRLVYKGRQIYPRRGQIVETEDAKAREPEDARHPGDSPRPSCGD